MERLEMLLEEVLERAKARGAGAADTLVVESDSQSVNVRCRKVEKVSEAREKRLGLRVFVGHASAVVSTADLSPDGLARLAEEAVDFARVTAPDDAAGLPDPADVIESAPDLDLYDPRAESLSTRAKIALATEAEAAALDADPAVTNSEGAQFASFAGRICYASTLGVMAGYDTSGFSLHVVPVATRDGNMQRDHWYTASRKFDQLEEPRKVGETAARRAVRRLGARKVDTCAVPIVFEPDAAATLVGHLAAVVSGGAVYRGVSFLGGRLGEAIAAQGVTVHDDGTLPGALGSKPFDGEGVPTSRTVVVSEGTLRSYLLDSYSARKLGLRTTGNAGRTVADGPGVAPTNLFLLPGPYTPEEILASVDRGLFVTEFMGQGINAVTGDYSRGAAGLWIDHGTLSYAVEEVTIAGNLLDMLLGIEMVGNDLRRRSSISAPTLKVSRMTVAGN